MGTYLWFGAITALFIAFQWYLRRGRVSSTEAHRLVGEGARLVDVRTPSEFAGGHLPGAVNVPMDRLAARLGELGPTSTKVVVYCQSGMRSARAARVLRAAGFGEVYDLGGIGNW